MNKKRLIMVLISVIIIAVLITILILILIHRNNIDQAVSSIEKGTESVSYPVSYNDTHKDYKRIENYVSGGSDFYCPNNLDRQWSVKFRVNLTRELMILISRIVSLKSSYSSIDQEQNKSLNPGCSGLK